VFVHKLSATTELRLLEERHAQELSDLTDRNREHLRAWLPWVDSSRTVEDRKKFIRDSLKQFAENKGFVAGIWHEGRLAGLLATTPSTGRTAPPRWATGSGRSSRAKGSRPPRVGRWWSTPLGSSASTE
jgi:ribosomal-protein-serine acetyltransferase